MLQNVWKTNVKKAFDVTGLINTIIFFLYFSFNNVLSIFVYILLATIKSVLFISNIIHIIYFHTLRLSLHHLIIIMFSYLTLWAFHFHSIQKSSLNILLNIVICVSLKKKKSYRFGKTSVEKNSVTLYFKFRFSPLPRHLLWPLPQ